MNKLMIMFEDENKNKVIFDDIYELQNLIYNDGYKIRIYDDSTSHVEITITNKNKKSYFYLICDEFNDGIDLHDSIMDQMNSIFVSKYEPMLTGLSFKITTNKSYSYLTTPELSDLLQSSDFMNEILSINFKNNKCEMKVKKITNMFD